MVAGLLLSETVCFDHWKAKLPMAHCLAASWQRRCQRWLSNSRIDVEALYGPLALWAIQHWQKQGHSLHLALDTTVLWNRCCVVVLSVVCHGRAIPLLEGQQPARVIEVQHQGPIRFEHHGAEARALAPALHKQGARQIGRPLLEQVGAQGSWGRTQHGESGGAGMIQAVIPCWRSRPPPAMQACSSRQATTSLSSSRAWLPCCSPPARPATADPAPGEILWRAWASVGVAPHVPGGRAAVVVDLHRALIRRTYGSAVGLSGSGVSMSADQPPDPGVRSPLEGHSAYRAADWSPQRLIFHQNLESFAERVGLLVGLQSNGKVTQEQAYAEIRKLWKELRDSRDTLLSPPPG